MFWRVAMERTLRLEPRHLDANLLKTVMGKLTGQVEGTCTGQFGYVVCVFDINTITEALVNDDGTVSFRIQFSAIVCRPFRGQVVDAVVTQVTKLGIFAEFGPINAFISKHQMPGDMEFQENSVPQKYLSRDTKVSLKKDDEVRLKVIGMSVNAQQLCVVGSLKEDFLGPLGTQPTPAHTPLAHPPTTHSESRALPTRDHP